MADREVKLRDEVARAERAARFLEDPVWVEAKQAVEKSILAQMDAVKWSDKEGKQNLVDALQTFHRIVRVIEKQVETGVLAHKSLTPDRGLFR